MKRALVTGSAGFVGRHMVAALGSRGWQVYGLDVATLGDALALFRDCQQAAVDLVVHCAARGPHRAAIDGDPAAMPYNVMLDAAMFDWAVRTRQRRVLYLSSSAVYPIGLQTRGTPYRLHEDDVCDRLTASADLLETLGSAGPLMPDAGYGWTKLIGERMAAAAAEAGLAVHVVRPFSGYGEDQGQQWPFGAFVARARRREDPFIIWGPGTQVRDWIHVDDLVAGALAVVEADCRVPVNLCTGVGTSMLDLAAKICHAAGYMPEFQTDPTAPTGVHTRVGSPERLHRLYRPKISLDEGVARAMTTQAGAG